MRIHVLDVGQTRYGDCLLVTHQGRTILIDGAHPRDSSLIRGQLRNLLNQEAPFTIDLLVITHCHSDHIGCLPDLVSQGQLKAGVALVADEKLGWGRDNMGRGPTDGLSLTDQQSKLFAALLEEDRSDLSDDELAQFIDDAANLEDQYKEMLRTLTNDGTQLIRYVKDNDPQLQQLEQDFADFGLRILGPTTDHLLICAQAIADATGSSPDTLPTTLADANNTEQLIESYRSLCRQVNADTLGGADRPGIGAAKNNQSIVLKVQAGGWSALLAGDMQFAKPEIPGLIGIMKTLRQKIKAAGPYDFIKFTHHSSYNAVDSTVLNDWPSTRLFAHTGGGNDASHPDRDVLRLLNQRQNQLTFARTDHNGLITVTKNEQVTMQISRGETNDFEPNQIPDEPQEPVGIVLAEPEPQPVIVRRETSTDSVEVTVRIPNAATKVTLSIEIEPEKKKLIPNRTDKAIATSPSSFRLAEGRTLPTLLVVTCWSKLARNVGEKEMELVALAFEQMPSVRVVDLPISASTADQVASFVQQQLRQDTEGVLILGGYDVVPANRLDTLDRQTRSQLFNKGLINKDADQFIVWSDDIYGFGLGSTSVSLPVSRIPDGRQSEVLFAALQAPTFARGNRFGVRNIARPFAANIFPFVPGNPASLELSEQFGPRNIATDQAKGAVYYMLHGSDQDGTRFWGETEDGDEFEAVTIANVPSSAAGSIIFTGCCWGALTVFPPAAKVDSQTQLRPRGPEGSIAIAYLKAGVLGFVGCTGTHYSPLEAPFTFYGAPMHDAFWKRIAAGDAPAVALFAAKQQYARHIPHGPSDVFSRAVEQKILSEYTCLGLGY